MVHIAKADCYFEERNAQLVVIFGNDSWLESAVLNRYPPYVTLRPINMIDGLKPQSLDTDMQHLFLFNVATVVLFPY